MKFFTAFFVLFLFISCDYFNFKQKKDNTSNIIATVNTEKLFKTDLEDVLPKNISSTDSVFFVKSFINDWAIQQLLLKKASDNSSLDVLNEIERLVKDYKESLLINKYKEELIKQRLDTIIGNKQIEQYYLINKDNFKLNEELIKIKYLHFGTDVKDGEEFINLFKSEKIEDLEELEKSQLSFRFHNFNDSSWVTLDNVILKLPFTKETLLKKTKFAKKEDSLGVYLISIKDVLKTNQIAPKNYIEPTIKKLILHKRKIELIRNIENTLLQDATKNNNFKTY